MVELLLVYYEYSWSINEFCESWIIRGQLAPIANKVQGEKKELRQYEFGLTCRLLSLITEFQY